MSRLICVIDPGNQTSINVALRIGMAPEGTMHDDKGSFLLYSMKRPSEPEPAQRQTPRVAG